MKVVYLQLLFLLIMKTIKQNIYLRFEKELKLWPKILRDSLKEYKQKTYRDDSKGLISLMPTIIALDDLIAHKSNQILTQLLGVSTLFLWTAYSIQDDLSDNQYTPKEYLSLANTCLYSAFKFACINQNLKSLEIWQQLLMKTELASYKSIKHHLNIAPKDIQGSDKSIFIMAPTLILIEQLNWPIEDKKNFLLASKYFLAAKQLADDVYDFREDWHANIRNLAHRNLNKLPSKKELTKYYQEQARRIIYLCQQCRYKIKTVSTLKKKNCFNKHLDILEKNCQKAFTN